MLLVALRVKEFPCEKRDRSLVGTPTHQIWTQLPKIRQTSPAAYTPRHCQHQLLHSVKPRLISTGTQKFSNLLQLRRSGVRRRHLKKEARVVSQASPRGICATQRDIGIGFSE